MTRRTLLCSLLYVLAISPIAYGQTVISNSSDKLSPDVSPVLSRRGELVFADDFSSDEIRSEWVPLHGTRWSIVDGALRGEPSTNEYQQKQIARDNQKHSGGTPSSRLMLPVDNCIMLFRFKLTDGLGGAHFGFNDGTFKTGTGHVCRFTATTRKGLTLQKDKNVKLEGDVDETLTSNEFKLKPDEWYWMMLEVVGDQMAAQVSGSPILKARHARIDQPKDQINLPTRGGGTIWYDHVRVWKTLPIEAKKDRATINWQRHVIVDHAKTGINSAVASDFDRDGEMDVIASYDGGVFIHQSSGWRRKEIHKFDPANSRNKPRGACIHSCLIDVDGDGDQDFVGSNQTLFWLECPDEPFSGAPWKYRTVDDEILGSHCVLAGDVNKDGKLDLIANSFQDDSKTRFPNSIVWLEIPDDWQTAKQWTRHVFADRDAPGGSHYMGLGDLNADGRPDITCGAKGEPFANGEWFAWWEQPADPTTVWKKHLLSDNHPGASNIHPVHVNGDTQMDIVATRGHGKGVLWFKGPDFKEIEIDPEIEGPHTLVTSDLDNDGDIDVAVCGRGDDGTAAWYQNDGTGKFQRFDIDASQGSYDLRAIDMDSDGDLDLLNAGHQNNNVVWYENRIEK